MRNQLRSHMPKWSRANLQGEVQWRLIGRHSGGRQQRQLEGHADQEGNDDEAAEAGDEYARRLHFQKY